MRAQPVEYASRQRREQMVGARMVAARVVRHRGPLRLQVAAPPIRGREDARSLQLSDGQIRLICRVRQEFTVLFDT